MAFQPQLEELGPEHEEAFLAFVADFRKNDSAWFQYAYAKTASEWTADDCKTYVKKAQADRLDWRPKAGKTSVSRYVLRDPQGAICASGWMRFPLDKITEIDGGNLTCDVAPSQRRHGIGSICLSLLLFEAVRAGLRRALATCAADDKGARRVIELNRGELQDVVVSPDSRVKGRSTARYWISFGG